MKKTIIYKVLSAFLMLIVGVVVLQAKQVVKSTITVVGTNGDVYYTHLTEDVDYIEFGEETLVVPDVEASVDNDGNIIITLDGDVFFKMIKVDADEDYSLRVKPFGWKTSYMTNSIHTFYIGEFEVTQGIWKAVMGSLPPDQSAYGRNYPIAQILWTDIVGDDDKTFLNRLNAQFAKIKNNNPEIAQVLGDREFRLPSEWEWEFAASGGRDWESLNYYFSGTSENTMEARNSVAVADKDKVSEVGTKKPNALGLYDMSGNVRELCSGLGYYSHELTFGFLDNSGYFNIASRPARGGSFIGELDALTVRDREGVTNTYTGFRLAL